MDATPQADTQRAIQSSQTEEWTYLAEGGAHLVFAYRGAAPSLRNKVLRVRKERLESLGSGILEQWVSTFERARLYFANTITPTLVPLDLLPTESRVSVDAGWIRELEGQNFGLRPKSRTSLRSSLPEDQQSRSDKPIEVSLVENLLGGEGDIAIEIKPKCGFLPDPRFLSHESRKSKTNHCRFCMHRSLRETQTPRQTHGSNVFGPMTTRNVESRYCPLDLFSADRKRRRYAVEQLYDSRIDTAGRGNNFRVFDSGKAVMPVNLNFEGTVDSLLATGQDKMTEDESTGITISGTAAKFLSTGSTRTQLCDAISEALDRNAVIPLLQTLQQRFDPLGIEQLGRMSVELNGGERGPEGTFPDELLVDPSPEELDVVKEMWLKIQAEAGDRPRDGTGNLGGAVAEGNEFNLDESTDLRTLLVFHGISAIFKDCSIIIRFPNALPTDDRSQTSLTDICLDPAKAVVKVIDLDLKPLKKANKWWELDDEIWRAYRERIAEDVERGSSVPSCHGPSLP